MKAIDLNADIGEGCSHDEELLDIISSASVACGGHAGSDEIMRETLTDAKSRHVRTGAHPGFADPENFGRRELNLPIEIVAQQVTAQIRRIQQISAQVGQAISYIKLHGALYNMAARDEALALHLFGAIKSEFGSLPILALDGSAQIEAASRANLPVIREGFADRAYGPDGKLLSRSKEGAVRHDIETVVQQAVQMARDGQIIATDGTALNSNAQSICLHGDNSAALELARAVRSGLEAAGIAIRSEI